MKIQDHDIVIVAAKRTPQGNMQGHLASLSASDLGALANQAAQKWIPQEPNHPHPIPHDDMEKLLTDCGYALRVNEDITEQYIDMIAKSWAGVDKVIESLTKSDDDQTETIQRLIKEAEYWMLRSKTMKDGHVKAWRFLAYKPAEIK